MHTWLARLGPAALVIVLLVVGTGLGNATARQEDATPDLPPATTAPPAGSDMQIQAEGSLFAQCLNGGSEDLTGSAEFLITVTFTPPSDATGGTMTVTASNVAIAEPEFLPSFSGDSPYIGTVKIKAGQESFGSSFVDLVIAATVTTTSAGDVPYQQALTCGIPPQTEPTATTATAPEPTATAPATATNIPTATAGPGTTTASVSRTFSDPNPNPGDTVSVTVIVSGFANAGDSFFWSDWMYGLSGHPALESNNQAGNLQNVANLSFSEAPLGDVGNIYELRFTTPSTGSYSLTYTYDVSIDPGETFGIRFRAQVFVYAGDLVLLKETNVTLLVELPATATSTSIPTATATATNTPTNTPVPPTATSTNTPVPPTVTATATNTPTNTPVPPTTTATSTNTPIPPTATNSPVPPTQTATATATNTPPEQASARVTLLTTDGNDIPPGTTLCLGEDCQVAGGMGFLQQPGVPSGSEFVFDDLPVGELNLTVTGADPYLDVADTLITDPDTTVERTVTLLLGGEPTAPATETPGTPPETTTTPAQTGTTPTAPVSVLPSTGSAPSGATSSLTLLTAALALLAGAVALVIRASRSAHHRRT